MRIADWSRFQGYKKRGPDWIKLHLSLLDQPQYLRLPIVAQAVLPSLWITAARISEEGELPDDLAVLAVLSHRPEAQLREALPALIAAGWIICDEVVAATATKLSGEQSREEREQRERESVATPSAPPPVLTSPTVPQKRTTNAHETWLTGYGEDWRARWGVASEPPFKQLAGTIRKAHDEHGEGKLRAAWRAYLASEIEAKWAKPATFVQGLGQWLGPRPMMVPARASPRPSVADQTRAEMEAFVRESREG
jgi:hypothetical protein